MYETIELPNSVFGYFNATKVSCGAFITTDFWNQTNILWPLGLVAGTKYVKKNNQLVFFFQHPED